MHRSVSFSLLCGVLCSFATVGCGEENPLNRQPVSGTVKLEGQPLARGSIKFEPHSEDGVMSGATITDGKYEIPAEKGLPVGEYTVRITAADGDGAPVEEMPGDSSQVAAELIPAEYNTDSQETIQVEAGAENVFNFDIPNRRASE